MSKAIRFLTALGAVFFAGVALAACGSSGVSSDSVAAVGGKNITSATFNHWMEVAATSNGVASGSKPVVPVPPNYTACIAHLAATSSKPEKGQKAPSHAVLKSQCASQFKSLSKEVLGYLISSEWVIGEAASLGVKVTDAEVKKEFKSIKESEFPKPAEFEKFLASSGQTVSDLLLRVKLNMLSQKVQAKVVKEKSNVTNAEIEKYYRENKARFGSAEKRNVAIILTKTEAQAAAAKKEVESGKSFASVAKAKSIDPVSKANGGLIKEVVKGQEERALSEAVFGAKVNVLSGPVKSPFGYYVYEVKSITPGTQQTLAQAKSTIKSQLASTNQQSALSNFVKEFKKKWTAKTECRSEYVVPDCKEYKAAKA